MNRKGRTIPVIFLWVCRLIFATETIEEKLVRLRADRTSEHLVTGSDILNKRLRTLRHALEKKHLLVNLYHDKGEPEEKFVPLLEEVVRIREEITALENDWRKTVVEAADEGGEGYAFWDREEVTLSELIMEYGSNDYLYVIPPEIVTMKLHVHSSIPVPRESWSRLLEILLSHNGIGYKQLNPYTRQLYLLKQDLIAVDGIVNRKGDLSRIHPKGRIVYILTPPPERIKGVGHFLERFRDPKTTFVYQVGYKIVVVSSKEEVAKLLTLYEAVWEASNEKQVRILSMNRIDPEEMEKILTIYFGDATKRSHAGLTKGEGDDLVTMPLRREGSLVLVGPKDLLEKAEKLVGEAQGQVEDPMEMTLFSYTCRHSDPIEISEVLEKAYASLIYSGTRGEAPKPDHHPRPPVRPEKPEKNKSSVPDLYGPPPLSPVVSPLTAVAGNIETQKEPSRTTNFIPFPKTGVVMMVVRRDTLERIRTLLRKIDVPKKMVRIEVLLFEKRLLNSNSFGLNIFRLGSAATRSRATGARFVTEDRPDRSGNGSLPSYRRGLFDFFFFRKKTGRFWPAFDIAYNFLLSQEDIRVNAAPSITTLNRCPAQISIVDEVSIANGASPVDSNKGTIFRESYSRADYGTTVVITPTIHEPELPEERSHFITLSTNISFETIKRTSTDKVQSRPDVFKRKIENEVRVADGETVILGGLRQKTTEDSGNRIPFFGDIPGVRKLFGESGMCDTETEMFVLITPKILFDGEEELRRLRFDELSKRPGDTPEFLERVEEAKERERKGLFATTFETVFGRKHG